ncbi:MAG: L,D-transpeptidase family protein [Deltaproteobacteria bacterium]|nr:L,D-transpeptidase family protein [Deltaproteobacteria bacterium]
MHHRNPFPLLLLLAMASGNAFAWQESDFPPRPVVAYLFELDAADPSTVVGNPKGYTFAKGDTLYDVARHLGLGINEVTDAYPDLDRWIPPEGESVPFPTWWVLPESDAQGVVVNIPEMRLYYFPSSAPRGPRTVITYPVGLGRDDWRTPTGKFRVTEKTVDPTWVIPDSIRDEHLRERGDPRKVIPGGDPANPLGHYRMRLSLPLYGIHGTNIPWGVGMEVSHGCIRLYPEDIERLFAIVPVGSPGEILYQPVKIGARDGEIYVEAHQDIYSTGLDYLEAARSILRRKGWESLVDRGRLAEALQSRAGMPTAVSQGRPLLRHPDPGPAEAQQGRDGPRPRS